VELHPSPGGSAATTNGKVTEHDAGDLDVTPLRHRLQHLPAPVIDTGLALAVAVVNTISIRVSPYPGDNPDVLAYALGLTIAALVLVRRRWPVAVLLVSAATMQVYYLLDYPGIRPAVPLAVALATAWATGHQRWSLLVVAWFAGAPLLFRTLVDPDPRPDTPRRWPRWPWQSATRSPGAPTPVVSRWRSASASTGRLAWIHRNVRAPRHVFAGQRPFADRRMRTKKMHGASGVNTP
jgi:hypothetical protein